MSCITLNQYPPKCCVCGTEEGVLRVYDSTNDLLLYMCPDDFLKTYGW